MAKGLNQLLPPKSTEDCPGCGETALAVVRLPWLPELLRGAVGPFRLWFFDKKHRRSALCFWDFSDFWALFGLLFWR
jgi:hypothetical protein